ncbi:MAG TPA: hypothetical protein VGG16_04675 [Streptosporangiaceae bacterium]|jgi:hypothetical protein
MTPDSLDEAFAVPTSADASRMLEEITPVSNRSRRLARDVTWAQPLLAWGLAWTAGTLGYQLVPGAAGVALGLTACAAAAAASWMVRPRDVRLRDSERRFALLWAVLFATSPLLVSVAAPASTHILIAFLGSVWAVGLLLYGAGVRDFPMAAAGLITVVAAAVVRPLDLGAAVLVTGLTGGLSMTALGAWRMRWRR